MFGIMLENRAFKVEKSFLSKALLLSFCQKCVLVIFRVKKLKKYFWSFLLNKSAFCLAHIFKY
jgi:hypothetical protein